MANITYDTLSNIWSSATVQPVPVQSNDGRIMLITAIANNGWFQAKEMVSIGNNSYAMDATFALLSGSEAIWTTL